MTLVGEELETVQGGVEGGDEDSSYAMVVDGWWMYSGGRRRTSVWGGMANQRGGCDGCRPIVSPTLTLNIPHCRPFHHITDCKGSL